MTNRALKETTAVMRFVLHHPANRGARRHAIGRAVAFQIRGRLTGRPTLATLGKHSVIEARLHSTAASKVVYANPPDWPEMLVWANRLRPGDLFIDVGANIGAYSILAAELGANVIAVEPQQQAIEALNRNASLNGYTIEVINGVLLDVPGVATFDFSGDTTAHLSDDGDVVTATTLDEVLGSRYAAGVKVDVEGAERLVLAGGARALSERRIACLQLEWNERSLRLLGETREPLSRLLQSYGYSLYIPLPSGVLCPAASTGFGADVFAMPDRQIIDDEASGRSPSCS